MPIRIGTSNLKKRFIGSTEVLVSYIGTTLVYKSITKYVSDFIARVTADSGVTELTANVTTKMQDLRNKDLFESASLVFIPSGYKASKVHTIIPENANGDLTFTRASTATRVNSIGVIESVSSNIPRIENGALLLEPQRTNVSLNSETLTSSWTLSDLVTVSVGSFLSPSNTLTAKLVDLSAISGTSSVGSRVFNNIVTSSGTIHTFSFYGRSLSGIGTFPYAYFDGANYQKFYADLTTEWKRFSITFTTNSTNTLVGFVRRGLTHTETLTQAYVWGAQLEQGSYPTSYIPTTTTTVTRLADSVTRSNVFTNGLITSQGGTWFVELVNDFVTTRDAGSNGLFIGETSGINNGFTFKHFGGSTRLVIGVVASNSQTAIYNLQTNNSKVVIKWDGINANIFVNGTKVVTNRPFSFTNMQFVNCSNEDLSRNIKQMALYPKPLTDAECITLTTL